MSTIDELRRIRLEKIEKLKELGLSVYPPHSQKDANNQDIVDDFKKYKGKKIHLCGRIMSFRRQGGITFAHIQDQSGQIQVFVRKETLLSTNKTKQTLGYEDIKLLDIGDFIEVFGTIDKTSAGEVSIFATSLRLLTKSIRPLPEKWSGIKDQETIFRRRYLDLVMNPNRKDLFIRKAKFWQLNRQFMAENGFIEVETPIMELVTGGADAKPFITHHNALDQDFYLRISSELYQKRLIGGGFEKIYTLGPNFRNEGIDDEHLQEYYQCEWYWAYADYRQNMDLVEKLYKFIAKNLYNTYVFTRGEHTFDLNVSWPRISYGDLIKKRFGVDIMIDSEAKILKILTEQKIDINGLTNRARIVDNLWKIVRKEIAGPIFIIDEPKFSSPLAKSREDNPDLTERFHVIIAGSELGNGYSELNDPVDQFERFKEQQQNRDSGDDESQMMDIDFVEMLEWGMPPTSGWGHSERLFWFLENVTAREGTLFPQMKYEVTDETRRIYNLPKPKSPVIARSEATKQSPQCGLQDDKVVIGEIIEFANHPNADKLHVLKVNVGQEILQIVCGANNIKVGDIVPVSLIGASVYGDDMIPWTVAPSKLRGVESNGMLCSTRELGLGPDHDGIYLLDQKLEKFIGEPVKNHQSKKKEQLMSYDRQKYEDAVKQNLENNIYNHSLSLESCMLGLYDYLNTNNLLDNKEPAREEWGLAGLIHDIDFAGDTKEQHPLKTQEVLAKYNLEINNTVQQIILSHDGRQSITMDSKAKWSIYCADSLTGLITAVAFVYPDKKLASVKVSSVLKRFLKEPKFAAGTRRDEVAECSNPDGLNLPLEKFIEICLTSMQSISSTLGL